MINQMFRIGSVVALITLASPPLLASNWHVAWVGNDETYFYFDAETVEKSKDSVLVWVKTVQASKAETDGSWATALRWRLNCTRKTIQSLAVSLYDQEGKFIRSTPGQSNDTLVIPDSTGEAMLKIACKANFPNDKTGSDYLKVESNDVFQATKNYAAGIKAKTDSAPK